MKEYEIREMVKNLEWHFSPAQFDALIRGLSPDNFVRENIEPILSKKCNKKPTIEHILSVARHTVRIETQTCLTCGTSGHISVYDPRIRTTTKDSLPIWLLQSSACKCPDCQGPEDLNKYWNWMRQDYPELVQLAYDFLEYRKQIFSSETESQQAHNLMQYKLKAI